YGDFIFHVFEEKSRRFYDLERLWRDAARVQIPQELRGGEVGGAARDAR
ncbi:MAG: Ribosomal silencing factor during starvation, partial [Acidobacteriota bacterium]|nr:Ribosomal silencing factor during starvation [Acidobacteriota bacterium]